MIFPIPKAWKLICGLIGKLHVTNKSLKIDRVYCVNPKGIWGKSVWEYLKVVAKPDGQISGIGWDASSSGDDLHILARDENVKWNKDRKLYAFPSQENAQAMLENVAKQFPQLPIVTNGRFPPISFSQLDPVFGWSALILPFAIPYLSNIIGELSSTEQCVKVIQSHTQNEAILAIGSINNIDKIAQKLIQLGANRDNNKLAKSFGLNTSSKFKVNVSNGVVEIICDFSNVMHYLFKESNPNLGPTKVSQEWDGRIHKSLMTWPDFKARMEENGLQWEGDNPEAEISTSCPFYPSSIPGWDSPASNGELLQNHLKDGAKFCAGKGMRVLINFNNCHDQRIQAIAAVQGVEADCTLVICSNYEIFFWTEYINGWSKPGDIPQISYLSTAFNPSARWQIASYGDLNSRYANRIEEIMEIGDTIIIVDGAHHATNPKTKRTFAVQRIASIASKVLLLTDIPMQENGHMALALLELLKPNSSNELRKEKGYTEQDVMGYLARWTFQ